MKERMLIGYKIWRGCAVTHHTHSTDPPARLVSSNAEATREGVAPVGLGEAAPHSATTTTTTTTSLPQDVNVVCVQALHSHHDCFSKAIELRVI